jgi:glyoxylase-like metal-dependent hydrolase (beta-lactamase superfamily II)
MGTLYFRQLLAGRDFGADAPMAAQMQNFVYVIGDRDSGEALLVDPAWAVRELVDLVAADGLSVVGALVTHYHPDHVGGDLWGQPVDGLATLMEVAPCPVHAHRAEAHGVQVVSGLSRQDIVAHDSGDRVAVGDVEVTLLHTPGHTPGSLCFRLAGSVVAGDTLFLQGCGRVDLPGGDPDEMFRSLSKLRALPPELTLYPGHAYSGAHATLGEVARLNQYLQIPDLETWRRLMS